MPIQAPWNSFKIGWDKNSNLKQIGTNLGKKPFFDFSCVFLNPNNFFQFESPNCSNLSDMRNLQEQVKKHSVTKNCSDRSLLEQIVLMISKFLQILGLQA